MAETTDATLDDEQALPEDGEGGDDAPGASDKRALLVQLRAKLDAGEPAYKIVRQCNELRHTLAEVLAIHLPDSAVRVGAVAADDPSAVVFNVTGEQFAPLATRHGRLVYSYEEIPARINVLSDAQLEAAAKKPAGRKRASLLGPVHPLILADDDDENDVRLKDVVSRVFESDGDDD